MVSGGEAESAQGYTWWWWEQVEEGWGGGETRGKCWTSFACLPVVDYGSQWPNPLPANRGVNIGAVHTVSLPGRAVWERTQSGSGG